MIMRYNRFLAGLLIQMLTWVFVVNLARADLTRTQTIQLHQGWNAVFLEVDPTNSQVAACFQGTPVTMVAAYTGPSKSVQFVQNPSTNHVTPQNGWDIWYASGRPDSFLTSFFELVGNKSYMIYSQSDYTWAVTGKARLTSVKWKPNAFTLTGFGVDPVSPPTFDQFFAGSPQHHPYQIYQLENGVWTRIDSAQTTQIQSGVAYWIYCKGNSSYQGPLNVGVPNPTAFPLYGVGSVGISLQNSSPNPLGVQVQNMAGGAQLPLAFVLRAVSSSNVVSAAYDLPDNYSMQSFDVGEGRGFWLTLRPERMSAPTQTGLLKITTDLGTQSWLPVTANQSDPQVAN